LKKPNTYQYPRIKQVSLITKDTKEKLVQEFRDLMQYLENEDHDEINNRLVDIVRNVRKTYAVGRDDDSLHNETVKS
jgi:uncharacterized membrane protein YgaE (UPF0421/DUF939 family)